MNEVCFEKQFLNNLQINDSNKLINFYVLSCVCPKLVCPNQLLTYYKHMYRSPDQN